MSPSGPVVTPVGTGSQPTVAGYLALAGLFWAPAHAPSVTTGGTKKVLISPLRRLMDRTVFAPASATRIRLCCTSTEYGLDSESTGTLFASTWVCPSGFTTSSYWRRSHTVWTAPWGSTTTSAVAGGAVDVAVQRGTGVPSGGSCTGGGGPASG